MSNRNDGRIKLSFLDDLGPSQIALFLEDAGLNDCIIGRRGNDVVVKVFPWQAESLAQVLSERKDFLKKAEVVALSAVVGA